MLKFPRRKGRPFGPTNTTPSGPGSANCSRWSASAGMIAPGIDTVRRPAHDFGSPRIRVPLANSEAEATTVTVALSRSRFLRHQLVHGKTDRGQRLPGSPSPGSVSTSSLAAPSNPVAASVIAMTCLHISPSTPTALVHDHEAAPPGNSSVPTRLRKWTPHTSSEHCGRAPAVLVPGGTVIDACSFPTFSTSSTCPTTRPGQHGGWLNTSR